MGAFPGRVQPDFRVPVADYVAFDLETTGLSPETDEILEVAMVRFTGGKPSERWSSLVNPGKPVPLKTLRLTHIDPDELLVSPPIQDLIARLQEFRGALPLVGHNSGFDAAFLARKVPGFPGVPVYDTLELGRIAVPGLRSYKLSDLARELGVSSVEAHRAYDDAEVSGAIFHLVQRAIARIPERARLQVLSVMGQDWSGAPIFSFALPPGIARLERSEGGHGASQPETRQPALFEEPAPSSGDDAALRDSIRAPLQDLLGQPAGIYAANVSLARDMARAIAREAADCARAQEKRLLLLGFPAEAPPDAAQRRGSPGDYLCLARLDEAARQGAQGTYANLDPEQRRFLAGLYQWAEATSDGLLSELQMGSGGYAVAPEVCCPPALACRGTCARSSQCFGVRALAAGAGTGAAGAGAAAASLEKGLRLDPRADLVLVWGGQDVSRAWQAGEPRVDLAQLRDALKKAGVLQDVKTLSSLANRAGADLSSGGSASDDTRRLALVVAGEVEAAAASVRRSLEADLLGERPGDPVDPPLVWRDLHLIEKSLADLRRFVAARSGDGTPASEGPTLRTVEQSYGEDAPKGPVLAVRAIWPATTAVSGLREASGGVVVMFSDTASAAFANEGGRRAMGLDVCAGAPVCLGGSGPATGILMLALDGGGPVAPAAYAGYLKGLLTGLAVEVRQRLLATFPSRALLKETYYEVLAGLEEQGIAVYGQGIDGGHRVVEHLAEEDSAVLSMTGGGPGPDDPVPTCLVLTRVPFAPPNPVDARRREMAAQGADGFIEVNVRPASLALRSHVEKMARSGRKCVVVLADPKLLPRRSNWGSEFLAAFGDIPVVTCTEREVIARARQWIKG